MSSRSSQIISSTLRKGSVNEETLVKLYDSNGIPPDLVVEEAEKRGINVSLPHNFYAQVARLHSTAPIKGKGGKGIPASLLQVAKDLPKTRRAYYEDQYARSINAKVLYSKDGYVVLDSTVFYPEGGGQIGDTGYLVVGERKYRVSDTQIVDGVIFHRVDEAVDLPIGSSVSAVIDWDRRFRIMRHHTVTHVILSAARKVLGDHVWQAGAEKTEEKGRLDLTHFKVPTKEEVRKIEELANSVILDRRPVRPMVVDRIEAETKYGMSIYAGGVQMMKDIRLLNIEGWDIEACGGTHVSNTSEIGGVKVINVEKIQDGVIRLEYVAGDRVVVYAQRQEDLIEDIGNRVGAGAADVLKRTEKIVDTLEKDESLLRMYRQDYVKVLEGRAQMREYGNYRVYWIGKFFDQEVVESFMRQVTSKGKTAVVHVFQDGEVTRLDIALSPDISGKEITSAIVKMGSCRGGGRGSRLVYTCQGISEEEVRKKLEEIITKTLH